MKLTLAIILGLLATIGTEIFVGALMQLAPDHWPMVDEYWTLTALPAIVVTVLIATALLWTVFRSGWPRYPIAFTLAYLCGLAFELYFFKNPIRDIAMYLLIATMVCIIVLGGLYRLNWRPRRLR